MDIQQQQRVASLKYYLFDRPLHPELFDIHHSVHLRRAGFEARLWVTGCTHVIGFRHGDCWATEVIADRHAELPPRGRLAELRFRGEREHRCALPGGVRYLTSFHMETMSEKVYLATHHDLARQGAGRGLFVPFPTWMTRPPLTPFSFLDYEAKGKSLHVFAYHAFPEDLALIRIQSLFEVT
ncbi:MAG: DUF2617 family protein [Planctomycetota bacterium]